MTRYTCVGCGQEAPEAIKACDCPTRVVRNHDTDCNEWCENGQPDWKARALTAEAKLSALGGGENRRTPTDYAIEHAGYLADAASCFLACVTEFVAEDDEEAQEAHDASCRDSAQALRCAIHEFRKRANRALSTPANPWRPIKEAPDAETVLVAGGDALYPVTASWSGLSDECWEIDGQANIHGEIGWPTHFMPLPVFPLPTPEEDRSSANLPGAVQPETFVERMARKSGERPTVYPEWDGDEGREGRRGEEL